MHIPTATLRRLRRHSLSLVPPVRTSALRELLEKCDGVFVYIGVSEVPVAVVKGEALLASLPADARPMVGGLVLAHRWQLIVLQVLTEHIADHTLDAETMKRCVSLLNRAASAEVP
jgi:hypothetical protein